MSDDYKEWQEKIEEGGGRHEFFNLDVDDDLLLDEEEYLDHRSICRRGHHSWEIGRGPDEQWESIDRDEYLKMQEEGVFCVHCTRCHAFGRAEIKVDYEGDLDQKIPHEDVLHTHMKHMTERDMLEVLEYHNYPQVFTFLAGGKTHIVVALPDDKWMVDRVDPDLVEKYQNDEMTLSSLIDPFDSRVVYVGDGAEWEKKMVRNVCDGRLLELVGDKYE